MATIDDVYALCQTIDSTLNTTESEVLQARDSASEAADGVGNIQANAALNNSPIGGSALEANELGSNLNSGDFDNQTGSYWFTIEITQLPTNAKTQKGGNAPDVIYAGWAGLKSGGFYLPREPIHFKKSAFQAQSGIDGFYFTLYSGFYATVTAYESSGGPDN